MAGVAGGTGELHAVSQQLSLEMPETGSFR